LPLPSKKKSKSGQGRGATSETPTSSTSSGSTQPSSPQVRHIPAISSSTTRDVPPHQIFRPSEEDDEDSDYDDIYVPFSGMKINANILPVEGMEYTDLNASERGGADAVDSETSDAPAHTEEGQKYQNLWSSEDDPRAIPLPDPNLICPTHHIACKKGICADMSKILRDIKKAKLKAEWEEKQKNRGIPLFFLVLFILIVSS
jgi:hypothetical protein